MKNRKLFSLLYITLLLALTAVNVMAASSHDTDRQSAGVYGSLHGIADWATLTVDTSTTITQNPDNAYIINGIQFSDGLNNGWANTARSERGVTSFCFDFDILYSLECSDPTIDFCSHGVQGGAGAETGYALYTTVNKPNT